MMPKTKPITATGIEPAHDGLVVILKDRRVIVPWERCSTKLATASQSARMKAELSPGGYGVHWPLLDEDLSVHGLIENSEHQRRSGPGSR
jgi:hypothetical protein